MDEYIFIFFVLNIPGYAPDDAVYPFLSGYALLHSFYAIIAWIVAAIVILVFYNGKKSQKHVVLNKWLFYIYYPLHLYSGGFIFSCNREWKGKSKR